MKDDLELTLQVFRTRTARESAAVWWWLTDEERGRVADTLTAGMGRIRTRILRRYLFVRLTALSEEVAADHGWTW